VGAWSGDWGPLLGRYRTLALRLAQGIVTHLDQAEDAVQEAARACLERGAGEQARLASEEHARNYFLRAVHHRALDLLRRSERAPGGEPDPADGSREPPEHDAARTVEERELRSLLTERVQRALASLRPEERNVVHQRYMEGRTFKEIAARSGASISTLHSRVEAGLDKIRRHLGKELLGP